MKRKKFKEKMECVELLMDGWRGFSKDFINSQKMISRIDAISDELFDIREELLKQLS